MRKVSRSLGCSSKLNVENKEDARCKEASTAMWMVAGGAGGSNREQRDLPANEYLVSVTDLPLFVKFSNSLSILYQCFINCVSIMFYVSETSIYIGRFEKK